MVPCLANPPKHASTRTAQSSATRRGAAILSPSSVAMGKMSAGASGHIPRKAGSNCSTGTRATSSVISERADPIPAIPPAARQHVPQSGHFDVHLVVGKAERMVELDSNASGEIFFESLQGHVRKVRKDAALELDRDVDQVVFAKVPMPAEDDERFEIGLTEAKMATAWRHAVRWIEGVRKGLGPEDEIYAILERDYG
jgi:hypothetical protein